MDCVKLKDKAKYEKIGVPVDSTGTVVDITGDGAYTVEFIDEEGYTYEESIWPYYEEKDLELVWKCPKD